MKNEFDGKTQVIFWNSNETMSRWSLHSPNKVYQRTLEEVQHRGLQTHSNS